jgi:response regulator RpfG family c-di-GMP phosphodiesterase
MRILLVDDDDNIRQFMVMILENLFTEVDIVEACDGRQATLIYESDPYYELIICDYQMPKASGGDFYTHLIDKGHSDIPFILHTTLELEETPEFKGFLDDGKNNFYIKKGGSYPEVKKVLKGIPFLAKHHSMPVDEEAFSKVRIFYFWRFNKTLCDIYLKLNQKKYVKIVNEGDSYGPELINKYVDREQQYLYIKKEDADSFGTNLVKKPFLVFDETITTEDQIARTNLIIQQMAMTSGINKSVVSLAEKNISMIKDEAKKTPRLDKLLQSLHKRMDYNYDHCTLVAYFVCALCDKLGWNTQKSKEKLCFAALFHDITLKNPDLAAVNYRDMEALKAFSPEEEVWYMQHPQVCAGLLEEVSHEYPQVDIIVEQHHERPDGSGFPRKLTYSKLNPLSCLFIVAHDFANRLYGVDFQNDLVPGILEEMKPLYTRGHFLKVVDSLIKITL